MDNKRNYSLQCLLDWSKIHLVNDNAHHLPMTRSQTWCKNQLEIFPNDAFLKSRWQTNTLPSLKPVTRSRFLQQKTTDNRNTSSSVISGQTQLLHDDDYSSFTKVKSTTVLRMPLRKESNHSEDRSSPSSMFAMPNMPLRKESNHSECTNSFCRNGSFRRSHTLKMPRRQESNQSLSSNEHSLTMPQRQESLSSISNDGIRSCSCTRDGHLPLHDSQSTFASSDSNRNLPLSIPEEQSDPPTGISPEGFTRRWSLPVKEDSSDSMDSFSVERQPAASYSHINSRTVAKRLLAANSLLHGVCIADTRMDSSIGLADSE